MNHPNRVQNQVLNRPRIGEAVKVNAFGQFRPEEPNLKLVATPSYLQRPACIISGIHYGENRLAICSKH